MRGGGGRARRRLGRHTRHRGRPGARRRRVGPAEQQYGRGAEARAHAPGASGRPRTTLPPAWITALVLLVLAGLLVLLAVLV